MGQSIKDGNETMVGEREKLHATEKRSFPHTNQEVFVWGREGWKDCGHCLVRLLLYMYKTDKIKKNMSKPMQHQSATGA